MIGIIMYPVLIVLKIQRYFQIVFIWHRDGMESHGYYSRRFAFGDRNYEYATHDYKIEKRP